MTSIPYGRDTLHGFSVAGRGVFLCEEGFNCVRVYAGQNPSRFAYALGVLTNPVAYGIGYGKIYAELDFDGKYHGRNMREYKPRRICALYDRGNMKDSVALLTNGKCVYNHEVCARDDPRLLAFLKLVAPVEVLPATAALYPSSPNPRLRAIVEDLPARFPPAGSRDGCRQRGTLPRRTLSLVGVRHSPIAAALQSASTHCARLCSIHIPLGLAGRGSRGQPATARGGARAPAATQCGGMSRGLLKDAINSHSLARMAYSRGYLLRHGTVRSKDWAATIGSTRASVPPSRMT